MNPENPVTQNPDLAPKQAPLVPAEDVAKKFNVTLATVHNWKNAGCPTVPMGHRVFYFDLAKVEKFLEAHPTYGKAGRPPRTLNGDNVADLLAAVKLRKEEALAARHEHNLARMKNEVLPVEQVREERLRRIAICRANLLAMPGKLAGRLAGRPEKEIYRELDLAVRDLLQEFAAGRGEENVAAMTEAELSTKLTEVA